MIVKRKIEFYRVTRRSLGCHCRRVRSHLQSSCVTRTPSRRICAVLQLDYDSLKCYLDSIRETAPIKRKRASSATASSTAFGYGQLQSLSSSIHASSQDMDILFKIDGEVEDALTHLGRLESSFERVHERLENIEDKMEQVTRYRLPSKQRDIASRTCLFCTKYVVDIIVRF